MHVHESDGACAGGLLSQVNNCIGYNNYKFFMLFCSYATITSFYVACVIFTGFVATIGDVCVCVCVCVCLSVCVT